MLPGPDGGRRGPRRRSKRRALIAVLVAGLVVIVIGVASTVGFTRLVHHFTRSTADYADPIGAEQEVTITAGESLRGIGAALATAGVVKSEGAFVDAADANPKSAQVHPGTFKLAKHMPAKEALSRLLDPSYQVLSHVVIPEGRTSAEIIAALSAATGVSVAQFTMAMENPSSYNLPSWDINPDGHKSEGFLFPATYDFQPGAGATTILQSLTKAFGFAAAATGLNTTAGPQNLTPFQVLTVASLVQAEAKRAEDMPKIAEVIYNRLKAGMKLELDTTVIYANGGQHALTTTAAQRALNSPYNTYVAKGLPPGPIDSPGEAAIKAALAPATGSYLYFVAVNPQTGETLFANTAAEHAANVAQFQAWMRAHPNYS